VLRVVTAVAVLCPGAALRAAAQVGGADVVRRGLVHGGAHPPAGFYRTLAAHPGAFEFTHGWIERARQVRLNRQALRSRGAWRLLNAPAALVGPMASATAVGGTLRYPTFLPLFSNTSGADSALMVPNAIASEFWGTAPAPPYSITAYYREISGGRLAVTGTVIPVIRVSQTDSFYAGYSGGQPCQGLVVGCSHVPDLILELVRHADSTVDFAQYADTATGYVPAIVILDPQVGGECYQLYAPASNSIWAHRYSLSGWGRGAYTTNDSIGGRPVRIDDYIIQGGQGGNTGCTPGQLAPIGTVTHETGHLFGLPDLYDTSNQTEGIGRWDLMSSGNEQKPWRPAHMSAWALATLGWISEVPVTTPQTVLASPIETGDTAYVVPLAGVPNEFFLLENRQPIGSDSMMFGPGLMIYHLDTLLMSQRGFSNGNVVNALWPHALAVEEAAGDTGLNCAYPSACNDRGDKGDPFPGTSGNMRFGAGTHPAANSNAGAFGGAIIDSIRQVTPFGAMQFRISFGNVTTVWASDTNAAVHVDSTTTKVFRDVLANGSTHTIAIDSAQLSADGRTWYLFKSWSDGLARSHTVTGAQAGATYTAALTRRYLVSFGVVGPGTVSATPAIAPAGGTFLAEGDTVTLTPVPVAGSAFAGWTGDTTAAAAVLTLRTTRPFALVANFVSSSAVVQQLLTGSSSLTAGQLAVLDSLGNRNGRFDVGDFLAWLDRNPGVVSGEVVSRILRRAQR
jgi:M6 family metalloprotease-like protein